MSLSLVAGIAAAAVAAVLGAPELSVLLGWIVGVGLILVGVWRISWPQGPEGTKRLAEAESRSRSTDSAVLIACVVSLAAVAEALVRSSGGQDAVAVAAVISSVVAVILAWALVNTVFALKYARMYYRDTDGGIDFKQQALPRYSDFAYMAFTVGMAFGVTETEPTLSDIRRVALGHALLSYVFGTGVVAVAINLVTNLGQQS
ncbi:DUF1345 domain-containing protein [Virgisporangium aliadipatigenens]|uniref:DUF1345 domain-containing protein n=1 Tax=Virgisporangium aliadipatigenens TaxID=741659 RepID=UPI001EF2BADB|nr:DUF1345 domain-containing protein [Virgisporangium aliadipatigenens]